MVDDALCADDSRWANEYFERLLEAQARINKLEMALQCIVAWGDEHANQEDTPSNRLQWWHMSDIAKAALKQETR